MLEQNTFPVDAFPGCFASKQVPEAEVFKDRMPKWS